MDAKELKKILNLLKGAGRIQLTGGYTVDTLVDDWMDGYKYASQQMPSEEEAGKQCCDLLIERKGLINISVAYAFGFKDCWKWLKSLQENQTED